jgi:membrane protease YdiL (CAAX protease family)
MKACNYCGRENEDLVAFCKECGTKFEVETPPKLKVAALPLSKRLRELNAWSATALLLTFFAVDVVFTIVVAIITVFSLHAQGSSPERFRSEAHAVMAMPITAVLIQVTKGLATILVARVLVRSSLTDSSPNGAAWVRGRWLNIIQGLVIGVVIAACLYFLNKLSGVRVHPRHISPLQEMVAIPGLSRVLCGAIVMLFAPFTEEILFRGVLYGGYRKSFGALWAAALTTGLFCLLHLPQIVYVATNLSGVVAMSLAALAARLRSGAIGPAIGVHVGYNTWIFALTLLRQYAA